MIKRGRKIIGISLAIIVFLIFTLFLVRAFSERELDDVTPGMDCENSLIDESDILWVVPNFNNKTISEDKEWCKEILALNKTLGMHGVSHEFEEFRMDRTQEYLEKGIKIFEDCFGFKPTMFKPPQLRISESNRELIKKNNLTLKYEVNQYLHKVYHCGEYGRKKNWIIDLF